LRFDRPVADANLASLKNNDDRGQFHRAFSHSALPQPSSQNVQLRGDGERARTNIEHRPAPHLKRRLPDVSVADESVDLIYLDPPFNSNASYNVLFKAQSGAQSQAQIEAFDDTWHWNESAERAFDEVLTGGHSDAAIMLKAMRSALGENDMMAYLVMMAVRLIELHRVLKPTGSLYLHCDPTACHYLKILLDAIFGPTNFRSDIIWKRQTAHSDATTKFASLNDNVLLFGKSRDAIFNVVREPLSKEYIEKFYRFKESGGRRYQLDNIAAPEGGGMSAIKKDTGTPERVVCLEGV
jgi:DNA modification methylase